MSCGVEQAARTFFDCVYEDPWTPMNVRRLFTSATQVHWSNPDHHLGTGDGDTLGCIQWVPGETPDVDEPAFGGVPTDERLTVTSIFTFDEKNPQQGVYVGTGDMSLEKKMLNNLSAVSKDNATETFLHVASIAVTFKHIHRDPDIALAMANSTNVFLYAMRKELKQHPHFMGFDPVAQSQPTQIEKSAERYFSVDLAWQFEFNYMVDVTLESHRLKKYGIQFNQQDA